MAETLSPKNLKATETFEALVPHFQLSHKLGTLASAPGSFNYVGVVVKRACMHMLSITHAPSFQGSWKQCA